ncbi:MAG TPA: putative S-layer protein [Candidatus Nanoarchaeia archaeon]|nr:putative S-layer protein [Candidatus Nanoarchaeia archaeon]
MKKLLLSILLVLVAFTALNVSAALTSLTITGTQYPGTQTGAFPGDVVTFTYTVQNTDAAAVTAAMSSTALGVITAPSIASLNVPAASTATGTFTLTAPSVSSGTYTGTLTAQTNTTNIATTSYSFILNKKSTWEVSGASLSFSGANGKSIHLDDSNQKITVKNTGSVAITAAPTSSIEFNDSDRNKVIMTFAGLGTINPGVTSTLSVTFSGNIPDGMAVGPYQATGLTITPSVESGVTAPAAVQFGIDLNVNPELCDPKPQGDLTIDIKDPDRNDDFKPGDVMNIQVSVKNNAGQDKDVIVEAFLWNIDENSEIASADSDSINVDKGKKEDFDMVLTVPTDESDLGSEDNLVLYIKASEDGNEEIHCSEKSVSVDGKRETRETKVTRFTVSPQISQCTQKIAMQVDVESTGKKEDKLVNINVRNDELGLDLTSDSFEIGAFDDNDNVATKLFQFSLPEDVRAQEYILEAVANYDGGKTQDSEFAKLTVKSCTEELVDNTGEETVNKQTGFQLVQKTINTNPGVIGVPFTVTNAEKQTKTFTVEVQPQGAWTVASTSNVVVKAGESKSDAVYVVTDKNLANGIYAGTVTLKSGALTLGIEQFAVNIGQSSGSQGTGNVVYQGTNTADSFYRNWVDSGRIFWVLGMIVILVLIVFFIRLIFKQ